VRLTSDWRSVSEVEARRYLVRNGPQHLLDEARHVELFALAHNELFLSAQAEELPAEPEAPLRTLQAALIAAARRDDAAGMAEFLLRHAQRTHALQAESPLVALRRGNPERARGLAGLVDNRRCLLWYLLLAWESKGRGRIEEAHRSA
jgi:hypothetical protein